MEDLVRDTTQRHPKQMYMRHSDVLRKCGDDSTVLAIRGLAGTTLEVPDPDEGLLAGSVGGDRGEGACANRRYEMHLKSERGAIDVYLISQLPPTSSMEHYHESVVTEGKAVASDSGAVQEMPLRQSDNRAGRSASGRECGEAWGGGGARGPLLKSEGASSFNGPVKSPHGMRGSFKAQKSPSKLDPVRPHLVSLFFSAVRHFGGALSC